VIRTARSTRPDHADHGFALLIVLWTIGLLALIGIVMTATGRLEAQRAANVRNSAITEAAADGAVFEAVLRVVKGEWRPGATAYAARLGTVVAEVQLEDEARKINPNFASRPDLQALLRGLGVESGRAGALTAAIVDWRTRSGAPEPGGAKTPQYRAAGLPYGPSGRPFTSLDEVGLVLGMTPDLLARLKPRLSIYNDRPIARANGEAPLGVGTTDLAPPGLPNGSAAPGQGQVLTVVVNAVGPGRSRFTRRAIVRVNATPEPEQTAFQILNWEASVD